MMNRKFISPHICLFLAAAFLLGGCEGLFSSGGGAVTREEFDGLRQRVDTLENMAVGQRMGQVPMPSPSGAPGPPVLAPAPAPASPPAPSGSERSLYQNGQNYLKQKNFTQAAAVFSQMLAQNPGGTLAPNARYWLGECHYAEGRYSEAAREFERCANDYPQSAKAPDALLKLSYSYDRVGDGPGPWLFWIFFSAATRLPARRP